MPPMPSYTRPAAWLAGVFSTVRPPNLGGRKSISTKFVDFRPEKRSFPDLAISGTRWVASAGATARARGRHRERRRRRGDAARKRAARSRAEAGRSAAREQPRRRSVCDRNGCPANAGARHPSRGGRGEGLLWRGINRSVSHLLIDASDLPVDARIQQPRGPRGA
eukprot:COSAG05_NODE_954_length_6442_cov_451.572915_12_plen_164_part_01